MSASGNDMVERVAIALWAKYPRAALWCDVDESFKNTAREFARAAIEAMREPTTDMMEAGYDSERVPPAGALMAYRAMIDAALE